MRLVRHTGETKMETYPRSSFATYLENLTWQAQKDRKLLLSADGDKSQNTVNYETIQKWR